VKQVLNRAHIEAYTSCEWHSMLNYTPTASSAALPLCQAWLCVAHPVSKQNQWEVLLICQTFLVGGENREDNQSTLHLPRG
jgi:hypothetical protein